MNVTTPTADEHGTYLLYVDVLGFSALVEKGGDVGGLCSIIDSLDAHNPGAFDTVVFSDAALVYATVRPRNLSTRRHLVMYLCEFAQDLFYRLVGKDLHFRAYLARGAFSHGRLENVVAFHGEALARARRHESDIQCTGLFIDDDRLPDCNVLLTTPYDSRCHFVHLMQLLEDIRFETYPIPSELNVSGELGWLLANDTFTKSRRTAKPAAAASVEMTTHEGKAVIAMPPTANVDAGKYPPAKPGALGF
jgi:hypothetical protein